jgi:hypothetical protein
MTIAKPIPWQDLLSRRFTNISDEYGPNSQAVASALAALRDTRWLERVGEPWLEPASDPPSQVTVVKSWDEALTIFNDFPRYNINGVLQAACDPCDRILERHPDREARWQKAREEAKRYAALSGWIPDSLPQEQQDLLFEHLWEFISMLLVEIIGSPEAECTYFREQLSWFHAGHFPCGWDGDWPNGCMRVY